MKRKLSLLLTFIFIITLALPIQGFAAEMDKELENAIKIAKTKFSIPESFKFSSSINTSGTKKYYYLSWSSADTMDSTNISLSVDENGTIVNYNKYSPSDYIQTKKLPKLSKQDAKVKSEEYIEWIAPGLLKDLQYQESTQSSIMETSYYLNYYRVVNGVPFYNDRVYVNISRDTGELQSYSLQWTGNLTFLPLTNPITVEKAEEAYSKNLGLRLIYKTSTSDDALKAYAVYVPIYDNSYYGVDAFTGERQRLNNNYYGGFYDQGMYSTAKEAARGASSGGMQLNPDELEAVQEAAKLLSKEEAENIARASKFLSISADDKLQSYYLSTNWPDKDEYVYSLQFNKPAGDTSRYDEYTTVTINAKTGVITGFYRGAPNTEEVKPKNDIATAKAAADAFLTENYPEYYKQMEYDKLASESYIDINVKNADYSFVYSRLVNGIAYPDNGVNINYDNVSGTIIGFNLNWYNISFPSVDKAIGIEAASDKLFEKVGLGLEYKYEYVKDPVELYKVNPETNANVLLVYSLKPDKPLFLDANTGELLTNGGTAYKEAAKVSYTDIKGHFAEKQIMVLADNGIYLEGTEFKPNEDITQKDFLTLISKTMSYYGTIITPKSSNKEIDELYAYLQREGIVKADEKAPGSSVTREDAVKFVIRALKYDKVADIKGIYNCSFQDKDKVDQNLIGYVTIAAGLGIVDGKSTNFRPKDRLTRSESAIVIYNYLQS